MTTRVTFISPAIGAELRAAAFEDGAGLDASGRARAAEAGARLRTDGHSVNSRTAVHSPTARCRETAEALGLPATPEPALAAWSMGRWRGRTLEELTTTEPAALAQWLGDPESAPHGGEPLTALCARVAAWLDALADELPDGRVLAVVEPELVRAAALHALGAPPSSFWRIDVPPLTATELTGRTGRWNLRCGRPLELL
ncbi:histidine phosphatase family protein [Kitasatospora sp. NPDC051853]|uniref:histidine phosphatase family protein n=1 Tax=Kitasatospora sp. NPDC051853 TaxID=3364058 RepID=UPI0037944327